MKVGTPVWLGVSVSTAGALGCAWRREWYNCIVLGTVAVILGIASAFAQWGGRDRKWP